MANFDPAFFTALVTLIKSTLDETAVKRSMAADRTQLENELRAATETLPLVYVHVGVREEAPEWGMQNQMYYYPVTVYYIMSTSGQTALSATLESKMASLRDAIIAYTPGAFQVIDFPEIHVESDSELNEVLYALGTGAVSAELYTRLLVGATL